MTRASVEHEGSNIQGTAEGPGGFVAPGNSILLEKTNGRWQIKEMVDQWTAN